jgi:hypothetical protein
MVRDHIRDAKLARDSGVIEAGAEGKGVEVNHVGLPLFQEPAESGRLFSGSVTIETRPPLGKARGQSNQQLRARRRVRRRGRGAVPEHGNLVALVGQSAAQVADVDLGPADGVGEVAGWQMSDTHCVWNLHFAFKPRACP